MKLDRVDGLCLGALLVFQVLYTALTFSFSAIPFEDAAILMRFADRVYEHCFHGALTEDRAKARLEPYKYPRDVVFMDDFPRTHLGKVDRGALAQSTR